MIKDNNDAIKLEETYLAMLSGKTLIKENEGGDMSQIALKFHMSVNQLFNSGAVKFDTKDRTQLKAIEYVKEVLGEFENMSKKSTTRNVRTI